MFRKSFQVPFVQFIHNGLKGENETKLQSFGVQLIEGNFDQNLVAFLGCTHSNNTAGKEVA